ncbi:MAG: fumarate hydratase [Clostridiales bacterium]|jgi:fumarate hydratase subunit alpha|nr:fumarate hydratase [Clostridiales bacterium]
MREIAFESIKAATASLAVESNLVLPRGIRAALDDAIAKEEGMPKNILEILAENANTAQALGIPICQDTGMAVIFAEIGQEVAITGGYFEDAIQEGIREGYKKGSLRNSIVRDPIDRVNTGDNTPAIIHARIVPGDRLKLVCAPKGFGSENMGAVKMLKPSDGIEGVMDFVVDTVAKADANPCPPIVVGVGVGGTMEKAALLSKEALLRDLGEHNKNPFWAGIEVALLKKINALGIGPAGLGGKTTALSVSIETHPTHIAGLPAAVSIGCHVTRHTEAVL